MTSGLSDRSEKVKLRGVDYVAYKMCQCAVLLKDKIAMCLVVYMYVCIFV